MRDADEYHRRIPQRSVDRIYDFVRESRLLFSPLVPTSPPNPQAVLSSHIESGERHKTSGANDDTVLQASRLKDKSSFIRQRPYITGLLNNAYCFAFSAKLQSRRI